MEKLSQFGLILKPTNEHLQGIQRHENRTVYYPHIMNNQYACDLATSGFLHGVQGVECSNHSVPTIKINDLRNKLYVNALLYFSQKLICMVRFFISERFSVERKHG